MRASMDPWNSPGKMALAPREGYVVCEGEKMALHRLSINSAARDVEAPGDMPLLWVLRDLLGLTGTKFGCGVAQCRACTVHLDGEAALSCQIRVADAAFKQITTIEGLSPSASHPLQKAWLKEQVPQCGYCQSGQLMSAAALLTKRPTPTDAEIDEAMWGNLCRCGTYNRIRRAIHRAAREG